jgi:hypothetical protein
VDLIAVAKNGQRAARDIRKGSEFWGDDGS